MRTIRTILRETGKEGEKIFQESGLTYDQFKEKNKRDIKKLEAQQDKQLWQRYFFLS